MFNKKRLIIYFGFCLSLFIGLLFEENSSGGSKMDYEYLIPYVENFKVNFLNGLNIFLLNPSTSIHSPVHYILISILIKITDSIFFVKIFYVLISCLLPYIFYLILKTKYNSKKNFIFLFSLIIFFSPYFRSSAIWILSENLSLILFSLSILFYLKSIKNNQNILNHYLCFVFLILCCYLRYYYCVFSIYFLIKFYEKLEFRSFLKILILSFILSLPALAYFYYLFENYNFINSLGKGSLNYYSSSILIISILSFYLFPFLIFEILPIISFYKKKWKNFLIISIPIIIIFILDRFAFPNIIVINEYGGGVVRKLSNILGFDPSLCISISAIICLLLIDYIFQDNRHENYLLLVLLLFCFPLREIFQEYLDPLFFIFFFGFINSKFINNSLSKETFSLYFIYFYFFSFLSFSIVYYL
jgi:hypothetical protein